MASIPLWVSIMFFVQYLAILACQFYSMYRYSNLLIRYVVRKVSNSIDLTPTMILYMQSGLLFATFSVVHTVYMLLYWHPTHVMYNAYAIYWTALPVMLLLPVVPTAVLFLSIDRCLILLFPATYVKHKMVFFARGAVLCFLFVMIVVTVIQIAPALPKSGVTECRAVECFFVNTGFVADFYVHLRWVLSLANSVIGIVFLVIMKQRNRKTQTVFATTKRVRYRLVSQTIVCYLVLDFLPHLANYITFKLSGKIFADYSPYSQLCSILDVALCAHAYWRTFRAIENSEKVTQLIYSISNQMRRNSFLVAGHGLNERKPSAEVTVHSSTTTPTTTPLMLPPVTRTTMTETQH